MSTSTTQFFERLAASEAHPIIGSARGTIRFDLTNGRRTDHWWVSMGRGTLAVTRADEPADCVVRTERDVFDALADGRISALPAVLRGMVAIEGDPGMLVRFQRLFPAEQHRATEASARTVGRQRS